VTDRRTDRRTDGRIYYRYYSAMHSKLCWRAVKKWFHGRIYSLRLLIRLTPTLAIWCNGNTPQIRVD